MQQFLHKTLLVIVSAGAEWRAVVPLFSTVERGTTPFGEWFEQPIGGWRTIFLHGGWGKISAAASTEYAIQRWQPDLVVNLGTCGGFAGKINPGDIVLAEETLVYDIVEQMGDSAAAIAKYTTRLDLSWLPALLPCVVRRGRLLSADRDILAGDVNTLAAQYHAAAADWESGAIAWVAARHELPCLILRGVTDLVAPEGGEAYGNLELFQLRAADMMGRLVEALPGFLPETPHLP